MPKTILYKDSFLVSGIMCHVGCGMSLQDAFNDCLTACQTSGLLPPKSRLIMDADPQALGIHRLFVSIESDEHVGELDITAISKKFKEGIEFLGFETLDNLTNNQDEKSNWSNWLNILINLTALGLIFLLSTLLAPSILLTIGLTAISFLTTAFTSRQYLSHFFTHLRHGQFTAMPTTITLGWILSLVHSLYHSISMPLMSSFSMTFMSFMMPIALITVINIMDELKRQILNKSKKMHLQGIKTLFPQMAKEYDYYPLSDEKESKLACLTTDSSITPEKLFSAIAELLQNEATYTQEKNALKQGMVINIDHGACFPVDCILIQGNTRIDAALLTGEPQQSKCCLDPIPAGAVNLGPKVTVYATADAYNSTVNKLLFRSNRAKENRNLKPSLTFTYLYSSFIAVGIMTSIFIPLALGTFTTSLLLQNVIGILFAICPCTIAIAHELPHLLSTFQRGKRGIILRDENLIQPSEEIHTVVFDKTGTLTTGHSEVESSVGITSALWERIYLLEKHHGAEHPLAKAITKHYERFMTGEILLNDINESVIDAKNRGLSAKVQGKKIHIGSADYLWQTGISIPSIENDKLAQGFSPVYVAQDGLYQGVIFIKHEIRPNIISALARLKAEGKRIIMLTGDNLESAKGFNQQNGAIFDLSNIHAQKTPEEKETFLTQVMEKNPQGVWFIGDGLNDAPCARTVTEKGGVSCAMTSDDKAAFFTDISLNGTLDYLFEHKNLNQFLNNTIFQNQILIGYSFAAFLTFIFSFSIIGIAVSPLIPLSIMASTTLFVLFNSYRVQLSIDNALEKKASWLKQFLASDLSIGLLLSSSLLLMASVLISTGTMGVLTMPSILFTADILTTISSICLVSAIAMVSSFALLAITYLFSDDNEDNLSTINALQSAPKPFIRPALPIARAEPSPKPPEPEIKSQSLPSYI